MATAYIRSPIGLVRVEESSGKITRVSWLPLSARRRAQSNPPPVLTKCAEELKRYFARRLKKFSIPILLSGSHFQKNVWKELRKLPIGSTVSYKQIAGRIGKPRAVRAVANAVGDNRIPILIPCHRVIAHDGGLGGYASGVRRKRWLLKHEHEETSL